MSDIKSCPYCVGYETTAGFVHFAGCPLDKSAAPQTMQDEIARLKAALEKAERERDSNKFLLGVYKGGFASGRSERDEARRWAKYFYQLIRRRVCINPDCEWEGYEHECHDWKHPIGARLCPKCHDVTELI